MFGFIYFFQGKVMSPMISKMLPNHVTLGYACNLEMLDGICYYLLLLLYLVIILATLAFKLEYNYHNTYLLGVEKMATQETLQRILNI